MLKRSASILVTFLFALLILFVSIFKSARVGYTFNDDVAVKGDTPLVLGENVAAQIEYELPYPGKILPDNSLWFLKAMRDKVWLVLTTDNSRRAELFLLFADKRLGSAKSLFEKGEPELGFSTLSKGEKYLESAAKELETNTKKGINSAEFAKDLSTASLKHNEIINEIRELAPEDAKPKVTEVSNYAEEAYKTARDVLRSQGIDAPVSPFDWD